MIRLAMLLVGARALRHKWPVLAVVGLFWMSLGLVIMTDASDGVSVVATEAFGILLAFEGFIALWFFTLVPRRASGSVLFRALALLVLGSMVLDFPVQLDVENSVLFGLAFLIDGAARIVTAAVLRFSKWPLVAAGGALELGFAAVAFSGWPVSYHRTVPFCVGVALLLSGWTVLRLGLAMRRLTDDMPVPRFFGRRDWREHGAAWPIGGSSTPRRHETPLVVRVWTPVGSAASPIPSRRLLVDRYVAAIDGKGLISTGHAALQLATDVYISHYPAIETDHAPDEFARLLRATADNNVKGHFQRSYTIESADWCPADANVEFHTYDAAKLRAHWDAYRADDTYNLTNRNCSVAVALALEAALEGTLYHRAVWRRFGSLVANPDLWIAALLRARAESMTWTPGLVLDYAHALHAIVERRRRPWRRRLQAAWRQRRHRRTPATQAA
jgi:uncharacterized membrane protein HdeD (DUF308 family)